MNSMLAIFGYQRKPPLVGRTCKTRPDMAVKRWNNSRAPLALRIFRIIEAGDTQARIGKSSGLGQSAIGRIYRQGRALAGGASNDDTHNVSLESLDRLADELGIPAWQLIRPERDGLKSDTEDEIVALVSALADKHPAALPHVLNTIRHMLEVADAAAGTNSDHHGQKDREIVARRRRSSRT